MQSSSHKDDDEHDTFADKATFWAFIAGSILSLGFSLWAFLKP